MICSAGLVMLSFVILTDTYMCSALVRSTDLVKEYGETGFEKNCEMVME